MFLLHGLHHGLNSFWYWVEVHTGTVNEGGPYYGWWSGFGGFITYLFSGLGAAALFLRHHNCHEPRCFRIGKHHVEGTPYVACRRHHPELADEPRRPKPGHMTVAWKRAREGKATADPPSEPGVESNV